MRAGDLDRRITLESRTTAQDAAGAAIETWTKVADLWSAVRPVRGREFFASGREVSEVTTIFRIRWRTGVVPDMRIVHDGQAFDIAHVAELGRHAGLELFAKAVT